MSFLASYWITMSRMWFSKSDTLFTAFGYIKGTLLQRFISIYAPYYCDTFISRVL